MTSHYKRKYNRPRSACQGNFEGESMAALHASSSVVTTNKLKYTPTVRRLQVLERRIGVLAGGDSPEREVSLKSGEQVHQALLDLGYDSVLLPVGTSDDVVPALAGIDVVFNVLHGGAGEDGTIALLLEVLQIPYPGSRPQACMRAMDKERTKESLSRNNIPVPPGMVWTERRGIDSFCADAMEAFGLPLVIKPIDQGSSIGVHIVKSKSDLIERAQQVAGEFGSLLVEKYVPGRELTAAILDTGEGEEVLPLVEVVPRAEFFDYSAKYEEGITEFIVPASLDRMVTEEVKEISLAAHNALGCSGYSRVDIRLDDAGSPYVLEVNTNPGMTKMSDLPRAAAAAGIDFSHLVEMMLKTSQ